VSVPLAAKFHSAAATDTGLVRDRNEDRYWIDAERGVFLVVDGVGGQAAGELAAQTAVDAIRESIFDGGAAAAERVRAAITRANNRIFERARSAEELQGMACVLTLAVVEGGQITIGHVGDSRLYLFWNGAIRKLTSDHSPVGEEEDSGELSEAEAMLHPRRNEVFRDVGSRLHSAGDEDFIEIRQCRFRQDAAILLCSDGLTDALTSAQVREIVDTYEGDAARVACDLVEAANDAGGKDNITALFVAGPEFTGRRVGEATGIRTRAGTTRPTGTGWSRFFTSRAAYLAYGLLIGMLVWTVLRLVRG
jgi:serine/threonine protein phosphatase PrpC